MAVTDLVLGMTATRGALSDNQVKWMRTQIKQAAELHLGACVGGDEAGFDAAVPCPWIAIVVHPPTNERLMMPRWKWSLRERIYVMPAKPYLVRNRDIVAAAHRMIALPDGPQRPRSGTWTTIGYAEQAGKRVTICYPDGVIDDRIPTELERAKE
jgi:hypothetical protein